MGTRIEQAVDRLFCQHESDYYYGWDDPYDKRHSEIRIKCSKCGVYQGCSERNIIQMDKLVRKGSDSEYCVTREITRYQSIVNSKLTITARLCSGSFVGYYMVIDGEPEDFSGLICFQCRKKLMEKGIIYEKRDSWLR